MATNHQLVGEALHALTVVLAPFVARGLREEFSDDWWQRGVLDELRDYQRRGLPAQGEDPVLISRLDAARCLLLMRIWWNDLFRNMLERDALNWVHELTSTRNRWAHAGRSDFSDDDAWRALDTAVRLLELVDANATEPLRARIRSIRSGASAAPASTTAASPSPRTSPAPIADGTRAMARIEVRDSVMWLKHLGGHEGLRSLLTELGEGSRLELDVDGFHGTWEKMRNGRDGRPTPGLKPQGPARAHWQGLYERERGSEVTVSLVDEGTSPDVRPVFELTLDPTYYNQGFFNVLTDFDRYVRPDEGSIVLVLGNRFQEIEARVDRSANRNGTARIMGGAPLRRWFQTRFQVLDTVSVRFEAPDRLVLG